jgi:hypothetical protein
MTDYNKKIQDLRLEIDSYFKIESREKEFCLKHLDEAFLWMGIVSGSNPKFKTHKD